MEVKVMAKAGAGWRGGAQRSGRQRAEGSPFGLMTLQSLSPVLSWLPVLSAQCSPGD